ncbi:MAG: SPOR domain-containing protein, partial [Pseudomonadota bacterium]
LELRGVTPDSDQATELSKTSADTANREVGLLRQMRTISLVFLLVLLVGIGIGIWSVWKPQSTDTVASSEEGTGQVPLDGKTPPIAPAQDNGLAQDSAAGEAAAINEAPGAPPSQSEDAGEVQRSANSQGELPNAKAVDAERNPIGVESGADAVVNLTAGTGPLSAPQPASGEEVQIGSETSVPGQISDRVDQDGVAARQVILPQEDQGNGGASEGTTSQGTTSQGTTSIEDLIKATDPAAAEVPTTGEDADRTAALTVGGTVGGTSPGTQSDLPPAPSRKPLTELETSRIPVVTPDPVGYVVQLYSAKNLAAAEAEGLRLSESLKAALGGGGLAIETADVPDSGTFYRLRSQTLETRAAADSLCAQFKQLGQDCLVVKRQ